MQDGLAIARLNMRRVLLETAVVVKARFVIFAPLLEAHGKIVEESLVDALQFLLLLRDLLGFLGCQIWLFLFNVRLAKPGLHECFLVKGDRVAVVS